MLLLLLWQLVLTGDNAVSTGQDLVVGSAETMLDSGLVTLHRVHSAMVLGALRARTTAP